MIETGILMVVALIATLIIVWAWQGVMHQHWVDKHPPTPVQRLTEAFVALGVSAQRASEAITRYAEILAKIEERHNV